jgi:hypothetical protein
MVVQLFTVYDRRFYSSSRCMTDGSTVESGAWPMVIQICMIYAILSPHPNSFRVIDLLSVDYVRIHVSTGTSDPCPQETCNGVLTILLNWVHLN